MSLSVASWVRKYELLTGKEFSGMVVIDKRKYLNSYTQIKVNNASDEMLDWCEETFGDNWIWNFSTFYFKYPKDAMFFRLKWV